jgi:hypothetical protein
MLSATVRYENLMQPVHVSPGVQDIEPVLFGRERNCTAVFTCPQRWRKNGETAVNLEVIMWIKMLSVCCGAV